jgi:GTP-binding protein EngB required for normal cell division
MEKRISISKLFNKNKYSISLLGQSKSGKSSLQSMLTASKKESR